MASYQYVYVMNDLKKSYPGGKNVLNGVTLSFFPGAKIGEVKTLAAPVELPAIPDEAGEED